MHSMRKTIKVPNKNLTVVAPENSIYEKDFFKWTKKQTSLLKKRDFSHLDIMNLIEEIESLGKSESYLIILLLHMLKSKYQPEGNSNSWSSSIKNAKHIILTFF